MAPPAEACCSAATGHARHAAQLGVLDDDQCPEFGGKGRGCDSGLLGLVGWQTREACPFKQHIGKRLTPCTWGPLYAKRKGRQSGSGCGDVGRSLADRSCGQLFRECYRML
jgi:hypothetical protein